MTSPDPHPPSHRPGHRAAAIDAARSGMWFGLGFGLLACIGDTLTLLGFGRLSRDELASSLVANVFLHQFAGVTLGVLVSVGVAGLFRTRDRPPLSPVIWYRTISTSNAPTRKRFVADLYALASVGGTFLVASFFMVRDLGLRIADRNHLALLVTAGQLTLLAASVALWVSLRRVFYRAFDQLDRIRPSAPRNVGLHGAIVAAGIGLGLTAVTVAFWTSLEQLDLASMASPAFALVATAGAGAAVRNWRRTRFAVRGLLLLSFAASASAGLFKTTAAGPGIGSGWAQTPVSRLARSWGRLWFDWDRDGQLSAFGDHDCNGFDARVHPGALDAPDNGTDEDCDGRDARRGHQGQRKGGEQVAPPSWNARPNLYLLTIDAFATNTLQSYGGHALLAPNLDRLASASIVFENHFVQGPSTRLSLPALFTSRYDTQIDRLLKGRFPFELRASNVMLAEVLKHAGYQTSAVLPHPYFDPQRWHGLLQGFDSVNSQAADAASRGVAHTAEFVTEQALEYLAQPRQGPMFLWVHYFDAHPPHLLPQGQPSRGNEVSDLYEAEIAHVDRHLGKLLEQIAATDDNYVIVVTGDHGIAFDRPRHETDHYAYDLSTLVLHVPLVVRSPHFKARRIGALTTALDLSPTLAQLAGTPSPPSFMGHSLLWTLLGAPQELPSVRFAQLYIPEDVLRGSDPLRLVSARTRDVNMVLDRRTGQVQAWQWQRDPEERHDLWSSTLTPKPGGHRRTDRDRLDGAAGLDDATTLRALKDVLDAYVFETYAPTMAARSH